MKKVWPAGAGGYGRSAISPPRRRIIFASPSDGERAMRGADLLVDAYIDRPDAGISAEVTLSPR